jgi:hypothetical protein
MAHAAPLWPQWAVPANDFNWPGTSTGVEFNRPTGKAR